MRTLKNINGAWFFLKDCAAVPNTIPEAAVSIDLPHTWNGHDGQDGGNDYFRGTCCYAKMLGVEALQPGYRQFRLDPRPCDLEFACGRVQTPNGNIRVKWQKRDDHLQVELFIPQGCSALLPDGRIFTCGQHRVQI